MSFVSILRLTPIKTAKCITYLIIKNMSSSNSKFNEKQIAKLVESLAPPLTRDKHKGEAGRIGVFGGSLEYTGAPYFAAISALKVGADLSHVFCTRDAAPVIKSYSPELIVHPLLDAPEAGSKIEPWLDRLHVVLIGPGLGRDEATFKVIDNVVELCKTRLKPLVFDADGLFYISQNPNALHDYPAPVLLTPNIMEFARLKDSNAEHKISSFLDLARNITILCKGPNDKILNNDTYVEVSGGGSGRRCGGQGDLLSGAASTFMAWALQHLEAPDEGCDHRSVVAAYAACKLTRGCNERAFGKFGRSMTTGDMIPEIHPVFSSIFKEEK